jgi:CRISPR/Cas system-associated exonuclease Cas4 (RecB family)
MITSFSEIKILDEDRLKLDWCLKYLTENNLVDYSVSESEIKFPWNKIILNGTPDLYGKSKTHQWVVDFKTGDIDQAKMVQYQAQLMLYSYGLNQLNYFDESLPIENYLIFLDRTEVKKFVYQKQEIKQSIDSLLFKMKDLSLINVDHCSQCQFQKICY